MERVDAGNLIKSCLIKSFNINTSMFQRAVACELKKNCAILWPSRMIRKYFRSINIGRFNQPESMGFVIYSWHHFDVTIMAKEK